MTTTTTICECGHAARVHSIIEGSECRVCTACDEFTRALDPDAAAEAVRSRAERRERAYRQLRRAVASWRLDEARRLLEDLIGAES